MAESPPPVRGLGVAYDQRRRDILEAVFTIVDSEGTDQVSIRNVASRAGVSVGRVQHYFPSKDDLLSEAFADINNHGTQRIHDKLSADDRPEQVLAVVLTALIPHTDADRRLLRVAQAFETYALTRPHLAERITRGYGELTDLLALLLQHAGAAPSTAVELLALTIGLAGLTLTGNLDPREAQRIAAGRLTDILEAR